MDKLGYTFYPKDWWTSDTFFKLPPELRYLYLEIISILYLNDGYWKPSRMELYKRFGVEPGDKGWEVLESLFVIEDGNWTHPSVNKRLKRSIANRKNGQLGGRPKTQKTQFENPKKPTLEREIEREIKEIYIGEVSDFWIAIKPTYVHDSPIRIFDLQKFYEQNGKIDALLVKRWNRFKDFVSENSGRVFNDENHLYNSFRQFHQKTESPKTNYKVQ